MAETKSDIVETKADVVANADSLTATIRKEEKEELVKFCTGSSIHGQAQIATYKGKARKVWICLTIVHIVVCTYQSVRNLNDYLSYHVQTSTTFDIVTSIDFPSIMFCSQYGLKRTTFSKIPLMSVALSQSFAHDRRNEDRLKQENDISCGSASTVNITHVYEVASLVMEKKRIDEEVANGSFFLDNKYFVGFEDVLVKCFWNNKLFDCSNAFINHISDTASCFKFNPGQEMADDLLTTSSGKGLNLAAYKNMSFEINRPNVGLRLLMKTNQTEYCGNDEIKGGAGLSFRIHNTNRPGALTTEVAFFRFRPGFLTRITLKKVVHNRKTEHIGRCLSTMSFNVSLNSKMYFPELCKMHCALEEFVKQCKCLPPNYMMFAKYMGSYIRPCLTSAERMCLKNMYLDAAQFGLLHGLRCKRLCIQPCYEETYNVQITYSKLRKSQFIDEPSLSLNDIQKNYMGLSVEFADMNVETIEETQQFTFTDFVIYVGNKVGLFFGMSFTSFFELLYLGVRLLDVCIRVIVKFRRKMARGAAMKNRFQKRRGKGLSRLKHSHAIRVAPVAIQVQPASEVTSKTVAETKL